MSWPWSELGLEGPSGSGEVKRAYAQRVKTVHPEEDPEGFQQLYAAYQTARRIARAAEQDARLLMEEAASEERRYDYNALFGEDPAQPPPEPERSGEFDYDALLAEEGASRPPPESLLPETEGIDYSRILSGSGGEPLGLHPWQSAGPEVWDYEKLLAEGDEERRKARLQEDRERRDGSGSAPRKPVQTRRTPWQKRVFREERAPLLLLWILMTALFFNYFFFLKPHEKAGPVPGTISIDQPANRQEAEIPSASDSPVSEEQHGLDAVRDLAVSLAAQDYPSLYAITNVGLSEHGEEPCYWAQCTGQNSGGETLVMNYFLTLDGAQVYCVSEADRAEALPMELAGAAAAGGKTVSVYRCKKAEP